MIGTKRFWKVGQKVVACRDMCDPDDVGVYISDNVVKGDIEIIEDIIYLECCNSIVLYFGHKLIDGKSKMMCNCNVVFETNGKMFFHCRFFEPIDSDEHINKEIQKLLS